MRVTRVPDSRNVARSVGLLLILGFTAAQDSQMKSFYGPRIDKWHKWWVLDPLKIGKFSPLKNAEITFHNQSLVNFGPVDNMPAYYTYGYRVYEPKAGEFKDHKEFRDGGQIHGSLRVVEKTGAKTNITYEGLPWSGWQALIETQDSSDEQLQNDRRRTSSTTIMTPPKLTIKLDFPDSATSESSPAEVGSSMSTISVDFVSSKEKLSRQTTPKVKPTSTATPATPTEPTTGRDAMSSKVARTGGKITPKHCVQVFRIRSTTRHSILKTPNLLDQVAQSWQNVSPQPQKLAKSSWQNSHHQMSPKRPSCSRMSTEHAGFPVLYHHLIRHVFSPHRQPRRQPSEPLLKSISAPKRKRYSIHHKKPTLWKRRHHPRWN